MYIGDALLDFGDGTKIRRSAKRGWYIYHSLPASHQAIFFPMSGLKTYPYDLQYKVSSDYALAARMFKAGFRFKRLHGLVSEFLWGRSTSNNLELCRDARNVQRKYTYRASGRNCRTCYVCVRLAKRKPYITKHNVNALNNLNRGKTESQRIPMSLRV
jgi:hypothetical protein